MSNLDDHALQTRVVVSHESGNMSDELNVWREASGAASDCSIKWKPSADQAAAAVIRNYGDQRYQQAIADLVEWLRLEGCMCSDACANDITRRFGKDA